MYRGTQVTLGIHVDDILVTCALEDGLNEVYRILKVAFKEVKMVRGNEHSYLGMRVLKHNDGIDIDIETYLNDCVRAGGVIGTANAPHKADLFDEDGQCNTLNEESRKNYHSWVMKILYRPDVLLTTSYLSSKVQNPNEKDMNIHLLRYLHRTAQRKLRFRKGNQVSLATFVDAAYAVHADGRSRTGILITMAGATILAKSSKQKMATKSSTEAEVLALSDGTSELLWVLEFLEAQGHNVKPGVIKQDNRSVITLMSKPKLQSNRTKHFKAREAFVRDYVKEGEIVLEDTRSNEMAADALTKPVVGQQLKFCTDIMLGESA